MCDRLVCYKRKYNTTLVSVHCGEDPSLGLWVRTQRHMYSQYFSLLEEYDEDYIEYVANDVANRTTAETHSNRLHRLIDVGFVWDPVEEHWLEMYQRLVAYKKENNSTLVSKEYGEDPELGEWVSTQRKLFRSLDDDGNRLIYEHRAKLLDDIGFVWDPLEARWNEMFDRLVQYKNEFGSTVVPKRYHLDPELGRWVFIQRQYSRHQRLSEERIKRLDLLGFVWLTKQ